MNLSSSNVPERIILLTGATSLIGSNWLRRLLVSEPDATILCPTRQPDRLLSHPRVIRLQCDLTGSQTGLEKYANRIEQILHCAATMRFSSTPGATWETNVGATRKLVRLAEQCAGLRLFVYVSTVYVAGDRAGLIGETAVGRPTQFFSEYERTKYEAELEIMAAEVPAGIVRLSSIIGDASGEVEQFNSFHQFLQMVPLCPLRAFPADPNARLDVIPSDWAFDALEHLRLVMEPGAIHHVCAGPVESLSAPVAIRRAYHAFGIQAPELVPLNVFQEPQGLTELAGILHGYLPQLQVSQSFDNARTRALLESAGLRTPYFGEFYDRVVLYCRDVICDRENVVEQVGA